MSKETLPINRQVIKEISADNITTQKGRRPFIQVTENVVKVPFDKLVVRKYNNSKSFNLRENFGDIEELAASLEAIGQESPIRVDSLDDGTFPITNGERRYRAFLMLIDKDPSNKARFEYVDAIINPRNLSEADRVVMMLASSTGKNFEPMEEAEGYRRLRDDHGMTITDISGKVGKSIPYIEQKLILADATKEEKVELKEGHIKPTTYVQLVRQEPEPEKRIKLIQDKVNKGKRLQIKDLKTGAQVKLCNEGLRYARQAQDRAKGETLNLLIEIERVFREIKKSFDS